MTEAANFTQQPLGVQADYLRPQEAELLAKLQRAATQTAQLQELAEATGIVNEEILGILQNLGYSRETVGILHLVPLVQVAWASGSVTPDERELVLRLAACQGVAPASPAWQQLNQWLDERPTSEFCLTTLRVMRHLVDTESTLQEALAQRANLFSYCRRVAAASRGFLGLGSKISAEEQAALAQIVAELTSRHPAAIQHMLEAD